MCTLPPLFPPASNLFILPWPHVVHLFLPSSHDAFPGCPLGPCIISPSSLELLTNCGLLADSVEYSYAVWFLSFAIVVRLFCTRRLSLFSSELHMSSIISSLLPFFVGNDFVVVVRWIVYLVYFRVKSCFIYRL